MVKVGNDCKAVTVGSGKKKKTFNMDYVFPPDSNQETVFQYSGLPLVDSVMAGFNCTLFAYGQVGGVSILVSINPKSRNTCHTIIFCISREIISL